MRCRWSLCVALAFGGDTVEGAPAEPSQIVSASNSCGVHCLIIVATLLRKPVPDFKTLRAMTATTNTGETNMLAMKHAAVAIGLRPSVAAPTESPPAQPCIAHVRLSGEGRPMGHFVVLLPLNATEVVELSPPLWSGRRAWSDVRERVSPALLMFNGGTSARSDKVISASVAGLVLGMACAWWYCRRRAPFARRSGFRR